MKKIVVLLSAVLFIASCSKGPSKLRVHDIYTSHMVIQRDVPVNVWGTAAPKTEITLDFAGKQYAAKADVNSNWEIVIDKLEASTEPKEMKIAAHDTTIVISDILVGDIWVCSGQSNMEWHLEKSMNGPADLKAAKPATLRYFPIAKDLEFMPQDTLRYKTCWYTVDSPQLATFSAVGYYFGKNLTEKLNIPIGLIECIQQQVEAIEITRCHDTRGTTSERVHIAARERSDDVIKGGRAGHQLAESRRHGKAQAVSAQRRRARPSA